MNSTDWAAIRISTFVTPIGDSSMMSLIESICLSIMLCFVDFSSSRFLRIAAASTALLMILSIRCLVATSIVVMSGVKIV